MKTTKAESAEVVRIASNQAPSNHVFTDYQGTYGGNTYRSVTFELANYNPFRFHATVGGVGKDDFVLVATDDNSTTPEKVTNLAWDYEPGNAVEIAFDVTSFKGTDDKSADPFGTAFEIYIDAPMLEIDETKLGNLADKLKADPNTEGRFIYTVDAKRDDERKYSTVAAWKKDNTPDLAAGIQEGERKVLPFKKKDIVSAGNIVISSNKEQVVFFDKTFKVTNKPIQGTINYRKDGVETAIEKGKFVAFELASTGSRIGSMTITGNGEYELRLRKEYKFSWESGEVKLYYTDNTDDGKVYHLTVNSLATLFGNPNLVLEPAQ